MNVEMSDEDSSSDSDDEYACDRLT
eukprot:COSAG02_NODE_47114_length_343_cov_1.229508_1_plen_25_part_10